MSLLAALLALLGTELVSLRLTAVWADREFTGWVAPIANRIAAGQQLYRDGGHLPMAPLPFVLMAVLFDGGALWWHESLLNFLCQAATLLLLHLTLFRALPCPVPLAATMATLPVFFFLSKTMFYDSLTQVLVATQVALLLPVTVAVPRPTAHSALLLAIAAVVNGLLLLTKQNTGLGMMLAAVLALVWFGAASSLRQRLQQACWFVVCTGLALSLAALACSPYIDLRGLLTDAFITGSEPKGGAARILVNFKSYALQIVEKSLTLPAALALLWGWGWFGKIRQEGQARGPAAGIAVGTGLGIAAALAAWACAWPRWLLPIGIYPGGAELFHFVVEMGFNACLILAGIHVWRRSSDRQDLTALACLFVLTVLPALFHSLSVFHFRWTYDNNPLNGVVLAALCLLPLGGRTLPGRSGRAAMLGAAVLLAAIVQLACWPRLFPRFNDMRRESQRWPEIAHLAAARMPAYAAGLRDLVHVVRAQAGPGDAVLLLPNDPDLEAWFERPRPRLTSAIIFTDQYWQRYVDEDFERLRRDPPKLIVIGPQQTWPQFQLGWGWAAHELIARVQKQILPAVYFHLGSYTFRNSRGGEDVMDVYVRRDSHVSAQ
jgi:hypothetical protein